MERHAGKVKILAQRSWAAGRKPRTLAFALESLKFPGALPFSRSMSKSRRARPFRPGRIP
jgi:hypothetical protein